MFAGKARAYPSEAPLRLSTLGKAPGLPHWEACYLQRLLALLRLLVVLWLSFQHTYVSLGVNGWSGRGIRCDGLDGFCDGRGRDCSSRRPSLHPNILEDRRKSKIRGFSGFAAAAGAAGTVGLSDGLRQIREESEADGERDKSEIGPRCRIHKTSFSS
jgi:hypothetical protein